MWSCQSLLNRRLLWQPAKASWVKRSFWHLGLVKKWGQGSKASAFDIPGGGVGRGGWGSGGSILIAKLSLKVKVSPMAMSICFSSWLLFHQKTPKHGNLFDVWTVLQKLAHFKFVFVFNWFSSSQSQIVYRLASNDWEKTRACVFFPLFFSFLEEERDSVLYPSVVIELTAMHKGTWIQWGKDRISILQLHWEVERRPNL